MLQPVRKALERYACDIEAAALAEAVGAHPQDVQHALRDLRERIASLQNNLMLGRVSIPDVVAFLNAGSELWAPQIRDARDAEELAETITEAVDYVHDFLVAYEFVPRRIGFVAGIQVVPEASELRRMIERSRYVHSVSIERLDDWVSAQAGASVEIRFDDADHLASTA